MRRAHGPWTHACACAPTSTPGILLAVGALEAAGILEHLAVWLNSVVPNAGIVAGAIGLVSALVDNVPLVAGGGGGWHWVMLPPASFESARP